MEQARRRTNRINRRLAFRSRMVKSTDMTATKTGGCFLLLIAPGGVLAGVALLLNYRPVPGLP
jgi:hypothetical protein